MGSILSSLTLVVFQLRQLCRHRMLQTTMFVGKGLPPNACLVDHAAMHAGRAREGTGGRGREGKQRRKGRNPDTTQQTTQPKPMCTVAGAGYGPRRLSNLCHQ